ncbi:rod shape-determining protein MreC [Gimesia panareensis]|uniref:Cell shape-determining protein MreC n=1 Tax=Gimesia panareensis TaxID=2527978 RepID=A0A517Q128_9PLAN|nr:rod shape-determining protein MreC [Gimesia panareensis]QDT25321.1 Cell shape-determining protein MreC [Gimesia panareensis]QDU48277.1 Cell shape-determining protein MreC [Gimesia panareensis]
MKRESRSAEIKLVLLALLVGIGLYLVPGEYSGRLYNLMRDAVRPGLTLVQALKDRKTPEVKQSAPDGRVKQLERKLAAAAQENRRLALERLQLAEELAQLKRTGAPDYETQQSERLLVPDLIEANILGEAAIALLREGRLLDQGETQGVFESSFVLQSDLPAIDQGAAQGMKAGYSLYAGQAVIGKISEVGKWTSTLIPITSVKYRGSARIARKTEQGLQLGTDGILVGRGEGKCELLQIPPTESIQVGQEVYTGEVDRELPLSMQSTLGQPMYYGRVIEAELPRGAPYWKIIVEPAVKLSEVRQVSVLRQIINPRRMLAN